MSSETAERARIHDESRGPSISNDVATGKRPSTRGVQRTTSVLPLGIPSTLRVAPPARLTRREAELLGLLAQGLNNKEIGASLWLSDRTVELPISGLYRKIGAQ